MNNLDTKNNTDSSVTVTDINNLQSLQQQRSSQRLRIKIDPTITTVSDIELTSRENDNDHYSPPLPEPATPGLVPKTNLDKLCFDTESQLNTARSTARGAVPISARETARETARGTARGTARSTGNGADGDNQEGVISVMNETPRHSIKIPSQYVEDRFKNIDNQLSYGRRKRNSQYYKNCTMIWIRNIIIFYVLFIIGMFFLYMCTDMLQSITFGYNQTNTNCSCQYNTPSNEASTNSPIINKTNIQYIPIPPKFWQQQLDNLTNIVKNMIDDYFTTSGIQYIENSTDLIVNNTINRLQTTVLHRMYIDEIISKQLDTNIITSDIIYTNKINTTDLNSTNILGINLFGTNLFGTNLTTSLVNTLNIITNTVQSIELFGNTLNKCTVGKC